MTNTNKIIQNYLIFSVVVIVLSYIRFKYVEIPIRNNYWLENDIDKSQTFKLDQFLLYNFLLKIFLLYPLKIFINALILKLGCYVLNLEISIQKLFPYLIIGEIIFYLQDVIIWFLVVPLDIKPDISFFNTFSFSLYSFINQGILEKFANALKLFSLYELVFMIFLKQRIEEVYSIQSSKIWILIFCFYFLPWLLIFLITSTFNMFFV